MYLDAAQPLLSVMGNLASARHWTALLRAFSFVHGVGGNDCNHCLNLELILKFNWRARAAPAAWTTSVLTTRSKTRRS